ncbi:hypothetical protein BCR36DRAFT_417199 [Piromyces finnis]|uniref:UBA domain-containing protein n=1 Tax=Piromyces finnis TaxID=1754191 RepID=A0A1Y1UAX5_9FUNG|nr:hypothetical protein BCR36DRAFT_417199 [Piromyces finnis]|eukprot:ORX35188.1 hypothetical protein BCR36DRAFT_417199 [Piromyces finnis]
MKKKVEMLGLNDNNNDENINNAETSNNDVPQNYNMNMSQMNNINPMNSMNQQINSMMGINMNQPMSPTMRPVISSPTMSPTMNPLSPNMSPTMNPLNQMQMQMQMQMINQSLGMPLPINNNMAINNMQMAMVPMQMNINQAILNNQALLNNNQMSQYSLTPEQLQQLQQMQQVQFQQQLQQLQQMQQIQLQQQIQAFNKQNIIKAKNLNQDQSQMQNNQVQQVNSQSKNKILSESSQESTKSKSKPMKSIAKKLFSTHKKVEKQTSISSINDDASSTSSVNRNVDQQIKIQQKPLPQPQQQFQQPQQQIQLQQYQQQLQYQQQFNDLYNMTNINAITTGQLQGMNNFMVNSMMMNYNQLGNNAGSLTNVNNNFNNTNRFTKNSNNATNGNIQLTTTPIISDNEKNELSKDATESSENVNQNITNLDGSSSNIKGKDSIKSDMKGRKESQKNESNRIQEESGVNSTSSLLSNDINSSDLNTVNENNFLEKPQHPPPPYSKNDNYSEVNSIIPTQNRHNTIKIPSSFRALNQLANQSIIPNNTIKYNSLNQLVENSSENTDNSISLSQVNENSGNRALNIINEDNTDIDSSSSNYLTGNVDDNVTTVIENTTDNENTNNELSSLNQLVENATKNEKFENDNSIINNNSSTLNQLSENNNDIIKTDVSLTDQSEENTSSSKVENNSQNQIISINQNEKKKVNELVELGHSITNIVKSCYPRGASLQLKYPHINAPLKQNKAKDIADEEISSFDSLSEKNTGLEHIDSNDLKSEDFESTEKNEIDLPESAVSALSSFKNSMDSTSKRNSNDLLKNLNELRNFTIPTRSLQPTNNKDTFSGLNNLINQNEQQEPQQESSFDGLNNLANHYEQELQQESTFNGLNSLANQNEQQEPQQEIAFDGLNGLNSLANQNEQQEPQQEIAFDGLNSLANQYEQQEPQQEVAFSGLNSLVDQNEQQEQQQEIAFGGLNGLNSLVNQNEQQESQQEIAFGGLNSLANQNEQQEPQQESSFDGLNNLVNQNEQQKSQQETTFSGLNSLANQYEQQEPQQEVAFGGLNSLVNQNEQEQQQEIAFNGLNGLNSLVNQNEQQEPQQEIAFGELNGLNSLARRYEQQEPQQEATFNGLNGLNSLVNQNEQQEPQQKIAFGGLNGLNSLVNQNEQQEPQQEIAFGGLNGLNSLANQYEQQEPQQEAIFNGLNGLNSLVNQNEQQEPQQEATFNGLNGLNSLVNQNEQQEPQQEIAFGGLNSLAKRYEQQEPQQETIFSGLNSLANQYEQQEPQQETIFSGLNSLANQYEQQEPQQETIFSGLNSLANQYEQQEPQQETIFSGLNSLANQYEQQEPQQETAFDGLNGLNSLVNQNEQQEPQQEIAFDGLNSLANQYKQQIQVSNLVKDDSIEEDDSEDDSSIVDNSNSSIIFKELHEQVKAQVNAALNNEYDTDAENELVEELEKSNLEHNKSIKPIMLDKELPELPTAKTLTITTTNLPIEEDAPASAPIEQSKQNDNLYIPRSVSAFKLERKIYKTLLKNSAKKWYKKDFNYQTKLLRRKKELSEKSKKHESTENIVKEFDELFKYIGENKDLDVDFFGIFNNICREYGVGTNKSTQEEDQTNNINEEDNDVKANETTTETGNTAIGNDVKITVNEPIQSKEKEVEDKPQEQSQEEQSLLVRKETLSKNKGKSVCIDNSYSENQISDSSSRIYETIPPELLSNEIKRSATTNNNIINNVISQMNRNEDINDYSSNQFIAQQENALLDSASNKENDLLAILFSMGFENTEENLKALRKANNNIDQAVNYLVEEKVPYDVINDIRENDFLEETEQLRRRYQQLSLLNNTLSQNSYQQQSSLQLANINGVYGQYNNGIIQPVIVNPNDSYILQNLNGTNSLLIDNNELNRLLIQQQQQQQQQQMVNKPPAPEYPGYDVMNNNMVLPNTNANTNNAINSMDNNTIPVIESNHNIASNNVIVNNRISGNTSLTQENISLINGNRIIAEDATSIVNNGNNNNININNNRNTNSLSMKINNRESQRGSNTSIIYNMSNSEIMNCCSDDGEDIETNSELSVDVIQEKSNLNNGYDELPITTSTTIDESLQSPVSNQFNNSMDSIQVSLDSPANIESGVSPTSSFYNNMINVDNLSLPRNSPNTSFDSTNQQIQLNAQIQQNQQQILKFQNQLQKMQMRNTQIERFYNNIQSPPEHIPYKTVTWYPKWTSHNSPFSENIVFHVKLNTKNEATLISTLKKRRNEARANPEDYNKVVLFCNHLFSSMKYIQNEQSDILNDALKLLKKSVKENSIEACNVLAGLYLYGIEGSLYHVSDYEKAGPLFMKVLKNTQQQQKQLNTESTYNLGICYENMDSKKKRTQAISFFKYAALNGHPGASFKMYKIYERVSPKEAIKWLTLSKRNATKEYPDGIYEYALLCYKGYESGGIPKNEKYTISLLKEAANKLEHVPSALELGKFFLINEGNTSTNAGKYLYKAACKDNKVAQFKLASWWEKQQVKSEMKKKAYFEWLSRAAEGKDGLTEAIYRVGYCYELGYGVTPNKNIAQSFYENAAARGYVKAKEKLEKMNNNNVVN